MVERNIGKLATQANRVEEKVNAIVGKKLPTQVVQSAKDAARTRLVELNNIYDEDDLEKYVRQFIKYFYPNDFPLGLNHRSEMDLVKGAVFIYKFNRSHNLSNAKSVISAILFVTDNLLKYSQFGGSLKMDDIMAGIKKYSNVSIFGIVGSIISLIINSLFTLPQFILKGITYAFSIGFVKMAFRKMMGKPGLKKLLDFSPSKNWCTEIFKMLGIDLKGDSARRLVQLTSDPMVKYFMLFSIALPIVFVFFRLIRVFIKTVTSSSDVDNAPIIQADKIKKIKESTVNPKQVIISKYHAYKMMGLIEVCRDDGIIKIFTETSLNKLRTLTKKAEDAISNTKLVKSEDLNRIKNDSKKTIEELQDMGNMDESKLKKYIFDTIKDKLPKELRIGAMTAAKAAYDFNISAGRNQVMAFITSFFIFIRFIYYTITRQNLQSKLNKDIADTISHPFLYWASTTLAIAIPTMIAVISAYVVKKGGIPEAIGAQRNIGGWNTFTKCNVVASALANVIFFLKIALGMV